MVSANICVGMRISCNYEHRNISLCMLHQHTYWLTPKSFMFSHTSLLLILFLPAPASEDSDNMVSGKLLLIFFRHQLIPFIIIGKITCFCQYSRNFCILQDLVIVRFYIPLNNIFALFYCLHNPFSIMFIFLFLTSFLICNYRHSVNVQ